CGLAQFLSRYQTHHKELLMRRGRFPADHLDSVAATWRLCFQQVKERSPAAAELLSLCAFFTADSLPEELLIAGAAELGPLLRKTVSDPLKMNRALETLRAYSLIRL